MNEDMYDIRKIAKVLVEAKRKKKGDKEPKHAAVPREYTYAEALDFSAPLGGDNLYRRQGGASWGPNTTGGGAGMAEVSVNQREGIKSVLASSTVNESTWDRLAEAARLNEPTNVWEAASLQLRKLKAGVAKRKKDAADKKAKEKEEKDKAGLDESKIDLDSAVNMMLHGEKGEEIFSPQELPQRAKRVKQVLVASGLKGPFEEDDVAEFLSGRDGTPVAKKLKDTLDPLFQTW